MAVEPFLGTRPQKAFLGIGVYNYCHCRNNSNMVPFPSHLPCVHHLLGHLRILTLLFLEAICVLALIGSAFGLVRSVLRRLSRFACSWRVSSPRSRLLFPHGHRGERLCHVILPYLRLQSEYFAIQAVGHCSPPYAQAI
jgi:hypothetical protein